MAGYARKVSGMVALRWSKTSVGRSRASTPWPQTSKVPKGVFDQHASTSSGVHNGFRHQVASTG